MSDSPGSQLGAEDVKLLTLARASRARTGVGEGAAVRDGEGRSYTAATVDLPTLSLSALRLAVATAAASGARGLEAAALVTAVEHISDDDLATVRDLGGPDTVLVLGDLEGAVRRVDRASG